LPSEDYRSITGKSNKESLEKDVTGYNSSKTTG
jgi:hypothetical protein